MVAVGEDGVVGSGADLQQLSQRPVLDLQAGDVLLHLVGHLVVHAHRLLHHQRHLLHLVHQLAHLLLGTRSKSMYMPKNRERENTPRKQAKEERVRQDVHACLCACVREQQW